MISLLSPPITYVNIATININLPNTAFSMYSQNESIYAQTPDNARWLF